MGATLYCKCTVMHPDQNMICQKCGEKIDKQRFDAIERKNIAQLINSQVQEVNEKGEKAVTKEVYDTDIHQETKEVNEKGEKAVTKEVYDTDIHQETKTEKKFISKKIHNDSTQKANQDISITRGDIDKIVKSSERTTHAIRSYVLFYFYQLITAVLALPLFFLSIFVGDDPPNLIFFIPGCVVLIVGVVYSSLVAWTEIKKSKIEE